MIHGVTAVAIATVDLTKLPSLNRGLDRRLSKKGTTDNLVVLFRWRREGGLIRNGSVKWKRVC